MAGSMCYYDLWSTCAIMNFFKKRQVYQFFIINNIVRWIYLYEDLQLIKRCDDKAVT